MTPCLVCTQEPLDGAPEIQEVQQISGNAGVAARSAGVPEPRRVSCVKGVYRRLREKSHRCVRILSDFNFCGERAVKPTPLCKYNKQVAGVSVLIQRIFLGLKNCHTGVVLCNSHGGVVSSVTLFTDLKQAGACLLQDENEIAHGRGVV